MKTLFLAVLVFSSACGTEEGSGTPAPAVAATIAIKGVVTQALLDTPVEDVKICVLEPEGLGCVTSDAQGRFEKAGIPANSRMLVSVEKPTYVSVLVPGETGDEDFDVSVPMITEGMRSTAVGLAGQEMNDDKGHLAFGVSVPAAQEGGDPTPLGGATIALTPSGGGTVVYTGAGSMPDVNRTATSADDVGAALVFNLDEGIYQVRVDHPSASCVRQFAWTLSAPNTVEVRIKRRYVTFASALCTP